MTHLTLHPVTWLLRRDPFVQLQLVLVAVLSLVLAGPAAASAPGWLTAMWVSAALVVLPFAGCLWGLRTLPDVEERQAWGGVAVSLGCIILTQGMFAVFPASGWPASLRPALNSCYLLFYVPFLVALEREPHLPQGSRASRQERWLRALGVTTFAFAWTVYLVLVPAIVGGTLGHPYAPTGLVLVLLDAVVVIRLVVQWHQTTRLRWHAIYAALAITWSLVFVTDLVDLANAVTWIEIGPGWPADMRWAVQWTVFVFAIRLRHYPFPDDTSAPGGERRAIAPASPARVGGYLVLGAMSMPLVHLVATAGGAFPQGSHRLLAALSLVAVTHMLLLMALANVAYRLIGEQRASMEQEQRALEGRLQHGQRMEAIGRLAGGVAHDFNNLLTVISGFTDIVQDGVGKNHAISGEVEEISKAAARAVGLTGQLLAFSRRQTLKTEPLDLSGVAAGAVKMLGRVLGEHIRLETDLATDLCPVIADAGQIEQVVMNLAVNARDAMPDGGTLTIATANVTVDDRNARRSLDRPHAGRGVELTVHDTGSGIPASTLPHIFEPFFTTKGSGRGTGLGLATVHGIVTQSGGTIDVDSSPGAGTVFTVRLPAAEGPARSLFRTPTPEVSTGGTQTILVAEDDEAVRGLVRTILQRLGYDVIVASSGEDALARAATSTDVIHLLLTDIVMPGINGRVLAERLAAQRPQMKILFMTGYADDVAVREVAQGYDEPLIQKPFQPAQLAARVRAALDPPPPRLRRG